MMTAKTGVTHYATPTDTTVRITRVVEAPRQLVFDAWTKPDLVSQWMLGPEGWTMPVSENDLRAGGAWRRVWRKANGDEMEMSGINREVTPPSKLVSTEKWGPEWPETVNTLELTEAGGLTTVTLTISYVSKDARDMAMQTGMKDGMEQGFARLEKLLASL